MTTEKIENRLVELMKADDYETRYKELFSPDVLNIEPEGTPWGTVKGLEVVHKKGEEFGNKIQEVHSN